MMNFSNLLTGAGITAAGAMPVIQQQQRQDAIRAAIANALRQQQSSQQPGFSPYPQANAGTPLPNGAPAQPSAPQDYLSQLVGAGANQGSPPPNPMPANPPPVMPYNGPAAGGNGDPFSYGNMANAFFGPGSNPNAQSVAAWEEYEKTARPYGQMQTQLQRTQMTQEGQNARTGANITSREGIEATREQGRMTRFYAGERQKAQGMSNVNLRAVLTTASQQIANGAADEKTTGTYAAASDELQKRAGTAGYKSEFAPPPDAGAGGGQDTVTVISPDGQVGTIPAAQLQDALKQGYKKQ